MRTTLVTAALLGLLASTIPAGYEAIPDHASADMTKIVYTPSGAGWDVTIGPAAHILFAAKDTAGGVYGVSSKIEQLAKPTHPEAYGLFIGGKNLADTSQRTYTYFVVRGTGEYLVKVMTGTKTTTITNWTANPAIPKEDAAGKASYDLYVHVAPTAIHFTVNGKLVAEVPKGPNPTDGVYGLRLNHNLHLMVTPVVIKR